MHDRSIFHRRIVGISGNLTRPSRTRTLVAEILRQIEARNVGHTELYDVADAGANLAAVVVRENATAASARVLSAIESADALVVATPVYKASYTGLFKHLFDLIDPKLLVGRPVILAATGGSDRHALVIDHQLRPLFAFFRAHSVPCGVYATPVDFTAVGELTDVAAQRAAPAVDQLVAVLAGLATAQTTSALARTA